MNHQTDITNIIKANNSIELFFESKKYLISDCKKNGQCNMFCEFYDKGECKYGTADTRECNKKD